MEAAAASRQLLELTDAEQPAAAARLVLSWMRLGQSDQARRWIDGRRTALAKSQIEVEGRRYPLDRWLNELLRPAAASAAGVTKSPPAAGGHAQTLAPWNAQSHHAFALDQAAERDRHVGALIDELIARRAASGIAPVFHGVPLVVGESLVVRTGDELAAYDLASGRQCSGRTMCRLPAVRSTEAASATSPCPWSPRRWPTDFSPAPHTAISSDGERIFTVVEDVAPAAPMFSRRRRFAVESPPKNSLVAFDRITGKQVWRLSDIEVPGADSAGDTRDVDFLGPPWRLRHSVCVARTDDAAHLLAVRPTDGKVRWSQNLAGFSGFEADSVSWSGPSCMPLESEGLLLCPTPDGLVIAVDLITHGVRWAYRVEPAEEPARLPPRWGRGFAAPEARWLSTWRETLIRSDGTRCYFISPARRKCTCSTAKPGNSSDATDSRRLVPGTGRARRTPAGVADYRRQI